MTLTTTINLSATKLSYKILKYFFAIEILFFILDITINYNKFVIYPPIQRLFNLAKENGLAAWFMTGQTLLVALSLWFIFLIVLHKKKATSFMKAGWFTLASFFTYLSADDGALIHERIGSTFKIIANDTYNIPAFFPSYYWQAILLPMFAFMGLFILFFLWKQFEKSMLMFKIIIAFSFLSTAIILDFFEGANANSNYDLYGYLVSQDYVTERIIQHFSRTIEELFEMIGMTFFLHTFVHYIANMSVVQINIEK